MCPPEMLPFHETLEKFFKKNFHEEIQRLVADGLSDLESIAPSSRQYLDASAQYPRSLYGDSSKISMSSGMTSRPAVTISSMNDRLPMSPPPMTPSLHSVRSLDNSSDPGSAKVTPLKLTLAHLARHGLNGVSSGVEATSIDMASVTTPTGASFVNVGGSAPSGPPQVHFTGSSFKGRLSRLGSLSFGRHG
jgi:dedicator of cytokinesis protein 3